MNTLRISPVEGSGTWDAESLDSINREYVAFQVLTTVVMKSSIFWDVTPSSLMKVYQHFRGTYCLILKVEEKQTIYQHEAGIRQTLLVYIMLYP